MFRCKLASLRFVTSVSDEVLVTVLERHTPQEYDPFDRSVTATDKTYTNGLTVYSSESLKEEGPLKWRRFNITFFFDADFRTPAQVYAFYMKVVFPYSKMKFVWMRAEQSSALAGVNESGADADLSVPTVY